MLIMVLAHARATGDGSLIDRYVRSTRLIHSRYIYMPEQYQLLKEWADYLANNTMPLDATQCVH